MKDETRDAAILAAESLLQGDRAARPENGELLGQVLAVVRQRTSDPQLVGLGGVLLARQGKLSEAARLLVDGIRAAPRVSTLHAVLGDVFRLTGDMTQAQKAWHRALELDPAAVAPLLDLARLYAASGRQHEALELLSRSQDVADQSAEYWELMGDFFRATGKLEDAELALCRALALRQPGLAVRMADLVLARGEWARGWLLWRGRHYLSSGKMQRERLRNSLRNMGKAGQQALLLWGDADVGDQLLLTRYVLPFVRQWAARPDARPLWLECAPRLVPLMQHLFPVIRVVSAGKALPAELPAAHVALPMFDLPVLVGGNEVPPPLGLPPLPPAVVARWKSRVGQRAIIRCGVAWPADAGLSDALRSLISACPEIEWHGLVSGAAERQLIATGLPIVNWAGLLPDALEEAGLLAQLDGVVTTDPALAYLAGLVGKPAWLLAHGGANWRWKEHWNPGLCLVDPGTPSAKLGDQLRQHLGAKRLQRDVAIPDLFVALTELPTAERSHQQLVMVASKTSEPARLLPWLRRAAANPQAALVLAQLLFRLGRPKESVDWFPPLVEALPGNIKVLLLASDVARVAGKAELARQWAEKALALDAGNAQAELYLGNALREQGNLADARAALERACALAPDYAAAFNNLGVVCREIGDSPAAIEAYERALEIDPNGNSVRANRGNALRDVGRFAESVACYQQLLKETPNDPELHYGLGNTYKENAEFAKSIEAYRRGLSIAPAHHDLRVNLSLQLLLDGELAEGWDMYEDRFKRPKRPVPSRPFAQPRWAGESLLGRSLLVWGEQGAGDKIMLARLVREAAGLARELIVETDARLLRLMQRNMPNVRWVAESPEPDPICSTAELQTPICNLARFMRRDLADFADRGAFLVADPAGVERWKAALAQLPGYRVGLVWAGNPEHQNDHNRSLQLKSLAPLFAVPGISFVSLQMGKESAQIAETGLPIADLTVEIKDYADTADLVFCLDLVISVDTSVAHLAGAMGVPTWVLVPFCPDWRWMTAFPETTPWYQSLKLYRQSAWCDWEAALTNIERDLRKGF